MSSPYSVLGNRPIDQWKVTELKEELRRRKLPIKGLKEDLVKRLEEAIRSERETCIDSGNGLFTKSNPPVEQRDAKINFMENQKVEDGRETILNDVDKAANDDVSMADVESGTAGTDGVIKEKDGKSATGMQAQTEESDQVVNAQVGDFKQVMKPQDGESGQVTKAQDGESYQVMKARDVECMQTGVNEESSKGVNDPDVKSKLGAEVHDKEFDSGTKSYDGSLRSGAEAGQMVVESAIPAITSETGGTDSQCVLNDPDVNSKLGAEVRDKEFDSGTKSYDGSLRSGAEAGQTVVESAIPAITSETGGTDSQCVLTHLESNGPESRCDKTQEEDEESKPPVEDDRSNMPNPNNQVSEVCHVLEFQVKCESISTVSVSINEKNKLKDNLNVDNFHLETEVKSDMVEQSSSGVPAIGGDVHSVGDQEPSENLGSREEADDNIAAKESLSKKNDSADVGLEKLNLDRSSGDDSMEEDVLDSKQIDSKHNPDGAVDRSRTVQSHEVKEGISIAMVTGSSLNKGDSLVEMKNITETTEKRKLGDYYEKGQTNEPTKRQRRWNLATVKVPEPRSTNLTPSSMPRDVPQSTNLTHSSMPRDVPQSTNLTHSSTPRDMPQSTNLTPSSTPRDVPQTVKKRPFTRSDSTSNGDTPKERVVPPSPKTPTTSLRIDRFLRPFTLKAVQELLAKTGNVCSFWMDHIKTHCYVMYSSVEEAVATRNALYNLQWPPNGGRFLTAEFVSPQEVQVRVEAPPVSPAPISQSPNAAPSAPPLQLSPHHVPRQQLPPPPLPPPPPLSDPPPVRERQPIPQPPPKQSDAPIVTLDDLFRKTMATPRIYYLPLSEEQVAAKLTAQGRNTKQ